MSAFAGLMVPRRPLVAELNYDERALAWASQTLATETTCLGTTGCFPRPPQRLGAFTVE